MRALVERLVEEAAAGASRARLRARVDEILDLVVEHGLNPRIGEATRKSAREHLGGQIQALEGHKGDTRYKALVTREVVEYLLGVTTPITVRDRARFEPVVLLEEEILLALGRSRAEAAADALVAFLDDHPRSPYRAHACLALGMTGRAALARHLVPSLMADDGFTRFCAYESLRHLTGQDFWADWMYAEGREHTLAAEKYHRWLRRKR